jgi:glycosyltransferase involved in cell wall biosynthesis
MDPAAEMVQWWRMLDSLNDGIRILADPAINPLFERPSRFGVQSDWYGHLPFAAWIVPACRPRVLVELGTHSGVPYAAFCDAVLRHGLPTRCFAVDTWLGEQHADDYAEAVYADFRTFHDRHYANFSTVLRMRFDEASRQMSPGSVDLLHIDGKLEYEAASRNFETWRPLLSDRAVVLLHNIGVRGRDAGVWRLWDELREQFPGFEFLHGHGLGVLAVGPNAPQAASALCALSDETVIATIRHRFALLGERWQAGSGLLLLEQDAAKNSQRRRELRAALREARARIKTLEDLVGDIGPLRQLAADLQSEKQRILSSTSWRLTQPIRTFGEMVPVPLRRTLRSAARAIATLRHRRASSARSSAGPADMQPKARRIVIVSGEATTPGHTYRVLHLAEAAQRVGYDTIWMSVEEADRRIEQFTGASIVVMWRTIWSHTVVRIVDVARDTGAKIVFDVDDLLFRPELAAAAVIDAIRSEGLDPDDVRDHFTKSQQVLSAADVCCCTTTELARHIRSYGKTAFVLPNGFNAANHAMSRLAVRQRRAVPGDGLVRIGYAAGSRTHQRDFAQAAGALGRVLQENPSCRLVLFETPDAKLALLDIEEFSALGEVAEQIEWRSMVPLGQLPIELARFDINIAPLQFGSPFCEAKSELKYFEAALVETPTVASPSGPLRRAIRHGETGMLAATDDEWYAALTQLVRDADLRRRIAHAAYLDVLWRYGPERRAEFVASMLRQMEGGAEGARAFALEVARESAPPADGPRIPPTETVFAHDRLGEAQVTVIIPLHNYERFIAEALESVRAQTLQLIDLIVIDDASTDNSLAVAVDWAKRNAERFNRLLVLRNLANAGLAHTRNAGFDAAETPFVLPLDADNILLPECCRRTLDVVQAAGAAFAYPEIQYFDKKEHVIGIAGFVPMGLAGGNYIDAMALVSKPAWAAVGGYAHIEHGWEDYDFWCRFAERGFLGVKVPEVLAEYRVHGGSMLNTMTDVEDNKPTVIAELESRHAWLSIPYQEPPR